MSGKWAGLLLIAIMARPTCCTGQAGVASIVSHDFRTPIKGRTENLSRFPECGLTLKDFEKPGKIASEIVELRGPVDTVIVGWAASLPNNDLTIRVRTAVDIEHWSKWVIVNDHVRINRDIGRVIGRTLAGLGGARYVRYEIDIRPETNQPKVHGCVTLIDFVTVGLMPRDGAAGR